MEALTNDPDRDITTIQVDLRLSTLKPRHANVMTNMYQHLKSEKGKEASRQDGRQRVPHIFQKMPEREMRILLG